MMPHHRRKPCLLASTKGNQMSKMNVNRRGPVSSAKNVTLRHLSPGETFRFPRSRTQTVYQLLQMSERAINEGGVDTGEFRFVYANVATGQVFGDVSNHAVVPVDCSLTVRDRVPEVKPVAKAKSSTRAKPSVKAKVVNRRPR
jgi:hypothetical protein